MGATTPVNFVKASMVYLPSLLGAGRFSGFGPGFKGL
jgi:hypothetical protein